MGILRFILAFTVVIGHTEPLFGLVFVERVMAVQAFYVISGFYMALILNEKYVGKGSYRVFITNRLLRLYPAYWLILLLTVGLALVFKTLFNESLMLGLYRRFYGVLGLKPYIYMLFLNIALIGQETLNFLKINSLDGSLAFTSDFTKVDAGYPMAHLFLFVAQAWTLSIEIMFYLVAPFIVRKKALIIVLVMVSSLCLRFYIYGLGLTNDPWTYRFFPSELAFFLSGAVAYKIYKRWKVSDFKKERAILAFIVTFTLVYQFLPDAAVGWFVFKQWIYYVALVFSVPAVFSLTRDIKADAYIGELSYPIYICHFFVLYATTYFVPNMRGNGYNGLLYYASLVSVLLFSIALVHFLIRPVDRYRQGRALLSFSRKRK